MLIASLLLGLFATVQGIYCILVSMKKIKLRKELTSQSLKLLKIIGLLLFIIGILVCYKSISLM